MFRPNCFSPRCGSCEYKEICSNYRPTRAWDVAWTIPDNSNNIPDMLKHFTCDDVFTSVKPYKEVMPWMPDPSLKVDLKKKKRDNEK